MIGGRRAHVRDTPGRGRVRQSGGRAHAEEEPMFGTSHRPFVRDHGSRGTLLLL